MVLVADAVLASAVSLWSTDSSISSVVDVRKSACNDTVCKIACPQKEGKSARERHRLPTPLKGDVGESFRTVLAVGPFHAQTDRGRTASAVAALSRASRAHHALAYVHRGASAPLVPRIPLPIRVPHGQLSILQKMRLGEIPPV